MKKITLLTIAFLGIFTLPATAQLGRIWTNFQYYSTDLQNYLKNNFSETLKPLETSSQNAINSATGDLNIPNPIGATDQIRKDIIFFNSIPDKFENNQAIRSNGVSNEINRLITRGSVVGTLGIEGQKRLKSKLEDTENSVKNIDDLVQKAEESSNNIINLVAKNLTQPISPQLQLSQQQSQLQYQSIKIQSEQAKIASEALSQTIYTNQSLQYSNLNLANISQQMEEANRSRRVDTSAEAARLLRTTAQIDLFGRKSEK